MDNLPQMNDEIRDLIKSINTGMIQKLKFKHIEAVVDVILTIRRSSIYHGQHHHKE